MSTITKEQAQSVSDLKSGYTIGHADVAILNELARIALESLEAEPVAWMWERDGKRDVDMDNPRDGVNRIGAKKAIDAGWKCSPLYTAPPVPVEDTDIQRKAAAHDVLCEKYNVESLADFVDWQRNHIAELEAAPPAPVGHGQTAVMPDYPGYVMTQRECFQAGKKAGLAEAGNSTVIPDGWVACSERMPEIGIKVLCFPVNDEPIHATYNGQVWLQDISWSTSDEPIDNVISCNVFHWMPLPAAPQQEA